MTLPFVKRTPFGVVVGRPVEKLAKDELLARLHPDEAALATTWGEARVRTFAAGRFVLREALFEARALDDDDAAAPILRDDRGAPVVPAGLRVSLSHKDDVAVALATRTLSSADFFVGVDVETFPGPKEDVAGHVLTEAERKELDAISDDARRRRELILRFSLKESLYKALDPYVQRYVGFLEVEVRPAATAAAFTLALKNGEGPFHVEGAWFEIENAVVTLARVTGKRPAPTE